MRKLYGLALLLCLPLLSYGQARNTGVRLKGPLYQDDVLLITQNLLQVRVEAPFYVYTYAAETYKDKYLPILLGLRYERLINAKIGFGIEFELNDFEAKKKETDPPADVPKDQQVIKVTPFLRGYYRKNRKAIFRGFTYQVGPTLMNIQQSLDESGLPAKIYKFGPATVFGVSLGAGVQHTFGQVLTVGLSAEAIFCGEQFTQELYYKANIGNGAVYINPFKLYVGGRF